MNLIDIDINRLIPYANNPRKNDKAVDPVANSIREFGFKVPIVISTENNVVCGHTRLKAAKKLGMKTVPCIIADDLTEEQITAFRLADNKVGELAEWDFDLLGDELDSIFDIDMSDFGFDLDFDDEEETEIQEDDYDDELPEEPKTKLGDIYQLGNHRLICGDSTDVNVIERLMDGAKADMVFTDPPYGVNADGGRGNTKKRLRMKEIINDDLRENELCDFLQSHFSIMPIKAGASIYVCYPWATQEEFTKSIKASGYKLQNCIVWRKMYLD